MKNILIVDDNKTNLLAAKSALSDIYKITAVTSGEQALKFLDGHMADLILLDINMPDMDGFQTMEKIRELDNGKDIPIIYLTADSDAETETRCIEAGAVDFISKPFAPAVIRSRIARTIEIEELRKNLAIKLDQKIQEVDEMKNKSYTDALTGLWNRVYTESMANEIINNGGFGSVFMMDMDNFKAINDRYGHQAGDNVLKLFADTMRKYGTEKDILCRIGGDEFIMYIYGDKTKNYLRNIAADIITEINQKIAELKYDTNTSASIGIAQYPGDGADFAKLYNSADKALYLVKQNGKSAFHFFSDQSEQDSARNSSLIDLNYIRDLMKRSGGANGSYAMDFDSFHLVYNYVRRLVERDGRSVQKVLFTLDTVDDTEESQKELQAAMESLEQVVSASLRRVDISARYSSRQIVVCLINAEEEDGQIVINRVLNAFNKAYNGSRVTLSYKNAEMEGKNVYADFQANS